MTTIIVILFSLVACRGDGSDPSEDAGLDGDAEHCDRDGECEGTRFCCTLSSGVQRCCPSTWACDEGDGCVRVEDQLLMPSVTCWEDAECITNRCELGHCVCFDGGLFNECFEDEDLPYCDTGDAIVCEERDGCGRWVVEHCPGQNCYEGQCASW